MRPIDRIRFAAKETGRFVLFFDKGDSRFAFIEIPFQKDVHLKLAPYLTIAAVVFMLPPDSNAHVDIFQDQADPVSLVFDYEVFNCINAYTKTLTGDEINALQAVGEPGECGCECPPNSGFWSTTICEDPIGTDATCTTGGVECS